MTRPFYAEQEGLRARLLLGFTERARHVSHLDVVLFLDLCGRQNAWVPTVATAVRYSLVMLVHALAPG